MPTGTGLCDTAVPCSDRAGAEPGVMPTFWGSWDTLEKQVAQVLAQVDYEQRSARSQRAAGAAPRWEQHTTLPLAPGQNCRAPRSAPRQPSSGLLPQVMLVISQGHWQQRAAPKLKQPFVQLLCDEIKPEQRITQVRAAAAAQQALPQHQHMLLGPPEQHTGRASTVSWPMPCPAYASSQTQLGATCWPSQALPSPKMGQGEVQLPFRAACALGHRTFPSLQPPTAPQSSGTPILSTRTL